MYYNRKTYYFPNKTSYIRTKSSIKILFNDFIADRFHVRRSSTLIFGSHFGLLRIYSQMSNLFLSIYIHYYCNDEYCPQLTHNWITINKFFTKHVTLKKIIISLRLLSTEFPKLYLFPFYVSELLTTII